MHNNNNNVTNRAQHCTSCKCSATSAFKELYNKKLSCHKETVRLLCASVLDKTEMEDNILHATL